MSDFRVWHFFCCISFVVLYGPVILNEVKNL